MKRLYQAADRIEAQLLMDFLMDHHVQAVVLGDYLSGAAGELSALEYPSVWLLEERDYALGRKLLEQFQQGVEDKARRPPWNCPNCGESVAAGFDLCWNCGVSRE